jgi:hypothetical protein
VDAPSLEAVLFSDVLFSGVLFSDVLFSGVLFSVLDFSAAAGLLSLPFSESIAFFREADG